MTADHWERVESLFHSALEQPAESRSEWLIAACSDPDIRADVERLLASARDFDDGAFISDALSAAASELADTASLAGQQFGSWKLIREVGRGGMGSVWLAERADTAYTAQAAIKFVRGAFFSSELARRFRAERQILADLKHPNIARLIDGGAAPDGTPFLAMEYVAGKPITTWAWEHGLGLRQRLDIFLTVCDAVQHAHRALVIHRDLKPGNILVDEEGVPKLVDFGIAKLLDASGGEDTTALIRPMTPAYASPEQIRGERVNVSSDVFSLGVVLYELLAGKQPFRAGATTSEEIQQRILEREPALPSVACNEPDEATRFVTPRALVGDLDNIVLMALRKETELRYATVEQLADDIRRYLDGLPVRARPATTSYRLRKFVRRNRIAVTGTMAGLVLVSSLVAFYTARLAGERDVAERERETAEQVTTFMTEIFRDADPVRSMGETLTVRAALDRGRERLTTELLDQPRVRARLLNAIGSSYTNLAVYATADTVLREALAISEDLLGPEAPQVATILDNLARLEYVRRGYADGRVYAERSLLIRERMGDPLPLARSLVSLASLVFESSIDSAQSALERALDIQQAQLGEYDETVAVTLYSLAAVKLRRSDYRQALEDILAVKAIRDSILPPEHPEHARTLNIIAIAYSRLVLPDSAMIFYKQALDERFRVYGPDHPETATALQNLATAFDELGQSDTALVLLQRSLDIRTGFFGESHSDVASTLMHMGNTTSAAGDLDGGIAYFKRAIAIYDEVLPPFHTSSYYPYYNIGVALNRADRYEEAAQYLNRAREIGERVFGQDHQSTAISYQALGESTKALGDTARAKELFAESLGRMERSVGREHVWITYPIESLARIHVEQGEFQAAVDLYRDGFATFERRYGNDPEGFSSMLDDYARALRGIGETEAADSVAAFEVPRAASD